MSKPSIIIVNDQLSESISAQDRGFFYADGIFETMWFSQGNIPLWQYHHERMTSGLTRLGIALDESVLKRHVTAVLLAIMSSALSGSDGVWKLVVTRGDGGRGYQPADKIKPLLISYFYPQTVEQIKSTQLAQMAGVSLMTCETRLPLSSMLAGIKSLNQLPYVLASDECKKHGVQEGLLLSESGRVVEATARNIFIIKNGELFTPELNQSGVAGVMRRLIIEKLAIELGMPVQELSLLPNNIDTADEILLCNGITGVWPVNCYDDKSLVIGDKTVKLQQAANAFMASNTSLSLRQHFL